MPSTWWESSNRVTTRVAMAIGTCDFAIAQRDRRDLIRAPPSTEHGLRSAKHLSRADGGGCCASVGCPRPRPRTGRRRSVVQHPGRRAPEARALRDRVVLLEFWTFACVNCQRTLPFLRQIHRQYQPDFTVVGVHSPEFAFERSVEKSSVPCRSTGSSIPSDWTTSSSLERVRKPVLADHVPHRSRRPDSLHADR